MSSGNGLTTFLASDYFHIIQPYTAWTVVSPPIITAQMMHQDTSANQNEFKCHSVNVKLFSGNVLPSIHGFE